MTASSCPAASAKDELVDLLPDDVLGAVHVQELRRCIPPAMMRTLLEALAPDADAARAWQEAVVRVRGPVVFALMPPPARGRPPDFLAAMEAAKPEAVDSLVESVVVPALRSARSLSADALAIEKSGPIRLVKRTRFDEVIFAYACREGLALGASQPQWVLRWTRGEWPERRWTDQSDVRRILGGLPKQWSVRGLVNPPALLRLMDKPAPNSGDELALKVLAPEDVRAAAVAVSWERRTLSARVTIALADECRGVARVLARPASATTSLGAFPEDFVAVGRVGWGSAQDVIDGAYVLTDTFDGSISHEYREDVAAFCEETGVDLAAGLLGNLVGEAAFGVDVDFAKRQPIGVAGVFPLRDAGQFASQLDKLVAHFELPFDATEADGIRVRTARETTPFAHTVHAGRWIVGNDEDVVRTVAKQASKSTDGVPVGRRLRDAHAAIGPTNELCVLVDMGQLRRRAPLLAMMAGPKLGPLLADGTIAAAMTVEERVARLDVRWTFEGGRPGEPTADAARASAADGDDQAGAALALLSESIAASLRQARFQAKQMVSASNMRAVGQALYIHAGQHKDAFPESLQDLVKATPDVVPRTVFISPYEGGDPNALTDLDRDAYVIYRPGLSTNSDPLEIILAEREVRGGGANFLFVDGHVEFIPEPRAGEIIELMRAGAEEIRR